MDGHYKPLQCKRTGRLTRAANSVLQFLTRALTPVDNPLTVIHEAPELPKGHRHSFSGELFTELLIELPVHRRQLLRAWEAGDLDTLRSTVHKLLGAVAYCDTPELEEAIRELRLALKTENQHTIDIYHERALNVIDSTLRYSGYRGHG